MARMTREPRATDAWYDAPTERVVMELGSGYQVAIPVMHLKEIAAAAPRKLAQVELLGAGHMLHWEDLDADYSVPALVLQMVGPALLAREAARAAGKVSTKRKAIAARKNGKRGGRPRKVVRK
jgi:uncharacterized protein DUF2442